MRFSPQMWASGQGLLLSKVARSTCLVNRRSMSLIMARRMKAATVRA